MVNFLWQVGDWFAKWKGGAGGALFACQDLFFLLDSQVIRISRLKNRLIIRLRMRFMGRCVFELRGINWKIIGWPSSQR